MELSTYIYICTKNSWDFTSYKWQNRDLSNQRHFQHLKNEMTILKPPYLAEIRDQLRNFPNNGSYEISQIVKKQKDLSRKMIPP